MQDLNTCSQEEEIAQLQAQVSTLEELLNLYEQSAIEQEQHLKSALQKLQERAQQLEHAQTALQTLQAILDSMRNAVVVVDQAGHALFSNPAARALLGSNPLEQSLHHWIQAYEMFDADGVTPYPTAELPIARALKGKSVDGAEIRIVNKSTHQSQWFSVNARPLKAEDQVSGAVAVFRDISQHKQSEQALRQSNEEFQQQAQLLQQTLKQLKQTQSQLIHKEKMTSLGQTIAGIAHEVNNPVSFIHGNLEPTSAAFESLLNLIDLIQQNYPKPVPAVAAAIKEIDLDFLAKDIPAMLGSMRAGTERIREIVKSLRVFSRLDEASFKAADIHEGIDSALMLLQSQLREQPNREAIRIHRNYGDLPLIECHAGQLNQALLNLLTNAVDALSTKAEAPEITICTEVLEDCVSIQISDNGGGMSEEIQSKIFDPFFTTKPVGKGMGLGLSICHQVIVETHEGLLECCSEADKGSRFTIKLPCQGDRRSALSVSVV